LGLRNIRDRLSSHYGIKAGLSIETDAIKGTHARIELPAIEQVVYSSVNHE